MSSLDDFSTQLYKDNKKNDVLTFDNLKKKLLELQKIIDSLKYKNVEINFHHNSPVYHSVGTTNNDDIVLQGETHSIHIKKKEAEENMAEYGMTMHGNNDRYYIHISCSGVTCNDNQ